MLILDGTLEPINDEYTVQEQVLDIKFIDMILGDRNYTKQCCLVKWTALSYSDATWELIENVDAKLIERYNRSVNGLTFTKV